MPTFKPTKNETYILNGATGTELQRRGFATELPLWSAKVLFDDPQLLKQVYIDYIRAGADIITTNTFRTQRRTLAKVGLAAETERINELAVQIAVDARNEAAADRPVYIAGCMTTLEDCYRPDLVPPENELRAEHREQAQILAKTEIDFFLPETFNSLTEARIAVEAIRESGKNFMVSFVINKKGNLLSGETLEEMVKQIEPLGPLAFGINCVQPEVATLGLERLAQYTQLPLGAYANGDGAPSDGLGWKFAGLDKVASYAAYCKEWKGMGATIIGGCCGTNPEYTRAYAKIKTGLQS